MSSLTEIAVVSKKVAYWSVILLIVYFIMRLVIGIGIQMYKNAHPIPVPPPDVRFNKLPQPKFTGVNISSSGLKFTLENVEGRPPETTAAGKVYPMPKKLPNLLAADKAKKFAAKLNFTDPPDELTSTYYRFTDPVDKLHTMEIDITNMNFKLKYDYTKNPKIFDHGQVMTREQALSETKNFIQQASLFDETILRGNITTDVLKFEPPDTFNIASSLSNANAIRINYFRNDLDNMKILSTGFDKSYNYVLYTAATSPYPRIVELSYTFWPITSDDFATYPLKSATLAWQDLIDGYAYVVNMGGNTRDSNIVIRKIYLAYYDSEEAESYLQPIFVFEGGNGFAAFVSAISSQWLE